MSNYVIMKDTVVYFLEAEETDRIKIGITYYKSLPYRIKTFQTGSPDKLNLLRFIPFTRHHEAAAEEHRLHQQFSHLHIHGEWFRADNELMTYIEENGYGEISG